MAPVLQIQLLPSAEGLPLPDYETEGAAGLDLRAAVVRPVVLQPGERALIPTGLRLGVPVGYEGQVRPRSGLALQHGITLLNTPGTIDSDYRGEVQVIVVNLGAEPFTIQRGDRIAQLLVTPVVRAELQVVTELSPTKRGPGGFGSTGKQ